MTKFRKFIVKFLPSILVITGISLLFATYYQFILSELDYYYNYFSGTSYKLDLSRNTSKNGEAFTNVITENQVLIEPTDTEFGLVIEKIGLNAPIVRDVPVINEEEYLKALKSGIAHASFSGYPNQSNSNVYLFAHSSNNFWELGKYSGVFNQLPKLNLADEINLFYEGKRYVYQVDNKILINDFKVDETIYQSIGPTLTLQTCYPAGTTLNRLVIRASLVGIFEYN